MNTAQIIESASKKEFVTKRVVNATKKQVFKAWTDPEHLKNWWGPKGHTSTFYQFDLRPKGVWSFVMKAPDGSKQPNECTFVSINAPDFVSWNHLMNPRLRVEASFEEIADNSTQVIFKMIFETADECNKFRALAGARNEERLDALEAELRNVR